MRPGQHSATLVRRVLLALSLAFLPFGSAAAQSCSPQDWWNALSTAGTVFTSGACASACADSAGAGCEAAVAVGAGLGAVAAGSNQGNVGTFCSAVSNAQNAGGDANTIQGLLSQAGISSQAILDALNGIADPLNVAQCGCQLEQGIDALGGQLVACLQTAICGLQQDLGWGGCACTPPAPVAANCSAPSYCATSAAASNNPECSGILLGTPSNPPSVTTKQLANGTFVLNNVDGWDGKSQYCTPDTYCFCPAPLTLTQIPVSYSGDGTVMYTCQCPSNTKPLAPSGPLSQVCICNNTGLPAVPPVKSTVNPTASDCPIPLTGIPCPNGQIRVKDKCVAPCAANQVMTPEGACCAPNHVSACGQCCPPGTVPNLANGSCSPSQVIQ